MRCRQEIHNRFDISGLRKLQGGVQLSAVIGDERPNDRRDSFRTDATTFVPAYKTFELTLGYTENEIFFETFRAETLLWTILLHHFL